MDKSIAAIELCSRSIKLLVGYVLDGKVNVIYAINQPCGKYISSGNIIDKVGLVNALINMEDLTDSSANLKLSVKDAIFALPSIGLKVYSTNQMTSLVSGDVVSQVDVKTLFGNIRAGSKNDPNESLVDIIPNKYELDTGTPYALPPFGCKSSYIKAYVNAHYLPSRIADSYKEVIHSTDIHVSRIIVSSQAAVELLETLPDIPTEYVLVDIGSDLTTLSIVGHNSLFASVPLAWGGDNITKKLVEAFGINEQEAEKIKMLYGYDKRSYSFDHIACTSEDISGNEVTHTLSEIKAVIKAELDNFAKDLNAGLQMLFAGKDSEYMKIPMVLIGGGSQLVGLKEFLEPKVPSDYLLFPTPNSIGARSPQFINCLGMILSHAKHPYVYDESHPKVEILTRKESK